ncbi:bifunctional RNase H/acid phosphatase [Nocardioides sp. zg-536]|uniref:Bifunctional RNase H/acid phosphatase n=1 Tax=Nocardioides faecalis TaxID=2803858 RepID=A0A939BZU1_9ACTN|nr:bifunctional RNase H/acid phosphatase [Nocardioides faecalis]MBM9461653.1 bifunctional RNase H/acid phosphatase [Nocardioides faecalis]MBS4754578.1 bifunctional RNase H/acid phosphatase [Nocardioides faecalis]QVI59923.1 bifunctional RNase H/acid phosphatase [Nocardioides faecalis]
MASAGPARVVVEADGGSRGNPGPAAYGAVLKDAATGAVIAEDGATIGIASNNVAEYSGLVAGLRLARRFTPGATIEVRMDSKLVVEQMSGRWKIKHPDMQRLAAQARELAPAGTSYTWVPRAANGDADALVNQALDGTRSGVTAADAPGDGVPDAPDSAAEEAGSPAAKAASGPPDMAQPTTVVLVRHGVTRHTTGRRFSGGLGGDNPPLSEEGRAQAAEVAGWLGELKESVDAVVASPVRRTRETADIIAAELGLPVSEEAGFAEMEFGEWDGLSFVEVAERDKERLDAWFADMAAAPPGGESFLQVQERVLAGLDRLLSAHEGRTVVLVSHVTPIKTLVAHAMEAPLDAIFRLELAPAAVSVISFYADPSSGKRRGSLRFFNSLAPGRRTLRDTGRW